MSNIECRPEALVIADALELLTTGYCSPRDGAAELRRQHAEIERLRALTQCQCGDEFTANDPGKCGACAAGETSALHIEIERLTAERDTLAKAVHMLHADADKMRAAEMAGHAAAWSEAMIDIDKLDPACIVQTCSRKHVQSVIEALVEEVRMQRAEVERITEAGLAHIRRASWFEAERDVLRAELADARQAARHEADLAQQAIDELAALRAQEPVTAQLRVDGCSTWHSFAVSDAQRWLANPWDGVEEVRLLYAAPRPQREVERLTDEWLMDAAGAMLYLHHRPAIDRLVRACAAAWGVTLKEPT